MLFDTRSTQFKAALLAVWLLPYLILAVTTRERRMLIHNTFHSYRAVLLFALSFGFLWILFSDFSRVKPPLNFTVGDVLNWSFPVVIIGFPGLPLLIISTLIIAITKPQFPYEGLLAILLSLFHALYLFNVVEAIFDVPAGPIGSLGAPHGNHRISS